MQSRVLEQAMAQHDVIYRTAWCLRNVRRAEGAAAGSDELLRQACSALHEVRGRALQT